MNALIAVNPQSAGGKALRTLAKLTPILRAENFQTTLVLEETLLEFQRKVRNALKCERFDVVICIGGDGLVHHLLEPVTEYELPLLIVPSGSGNDCARTLGIHKKTPAELVQLFLKRSITPIDLGCVSSKVVSKLFFQIASTGFDADVSEVANSLRRTPASLKYLVATLRSAFRVQSRSYEVVIDGAKLSLDAMLFLVANGPNYGGGMKIVPHADNSDGLLEVMYVERVSPLRLLAVFPRVYLGIHTHHPKVHFLQGREITISAPSQLYADGERVSELPVIVTLAPMKLHVVSA